MVLFFVLLTLPITDFKPGKDMIIIIIIFIISLIVTITPSHFIIRWIYSSYMTRGRGTL